jgi:hypothetical protein
MSTTPINNALFIVKAADGNLTKNLGTRASAG